MFLIHKCNVSLRNKTQAVFADNKATARVFVVAFLTKPKMSFYVLWLTYWTILFCQGHPSWTKPYAICQNYDASVRFKALVSTSLTRLTYQKLSLIDISKWFAYSLRQLYSSFIWPSAGCAPMLWFFFHQVIGIKQKSVNTDHVLNHFSLVSGINRTAADAKSLSASIHLVYKLPHLILVTMLCYREFEWLKMSLRANSYCLNQCILKPILADAFFQSFRERFGP